MRNGSPSVSRRAIRRAVVTTLESLEQRTLFSAGALDPTFGSGGIVTTDFPGADLDVAQNATRLNNGQMVVVGTTDGHTVLARYDANGTRDASFGDGGEALIGDSVLDFVSAVGEDSNGGLIVTGQAPDGAAAIARFTASGSLDTSFGTGGVTEVAAAGSGAGSLVFDASHNILVTTQGTGDFTVIRLTSDGTLDTSFGGGNGFASVDFGSNDQATAIALDNGAILLGGATGFGDRDAALARIDDTNGDLDPGFADGGRFTIDPRIAGGGTDDAIDAIKVRSGGDILIAGVTGQDFLLAKLLDNGTVDASFGETQGVTTTNFASFGQSFDEAKTIDTDSTGNIVLTGQTSDGGGVVPVARYTSNGILDNTFGNGGLAEAPISGTAGSVASFINGNDSILTVGSASGPGGSDFAFVQFDSAGNLDGSFGSGGVVTDGFTGPKGDAGLAVAQDGNGNTIVAGSTSSNSSEDIAIARYLPNGSLDSSFGNGGRVTLSVSGSDEAHAVTVTTGGKILVAFNSNGDFGVAEFNNNGSLNTSFGGGQGYVVLSTASTDDQVAAIGLSPDENSIYVAGTQETSGDQNFEFARLSSSGAIIYGDDANPAATVDFGSDPMTPNSDQLGGMAIQPDGNIVLAGFSGSSSGNNTAVARLLPDGSLDPSFGTGGKVSTDLNFDIGSAVALDSAGNIYVAGESQFDQITTVVKYDSTGNRITSGFGDSNGVASVAIEAGSFPASIAIAPSGLIVVAGTASNSSSGGNDFGIARFNTDGTVDSSFGSAGVSIVSIGNSAEVGGMLIQSSDGNIVVAGRTDDTGDFATIRLDGTGDVVATPPAPVANAGADADVNEGGTVSFDGTASTGTGLTYAWDLDGDGQFDDAFTPTATFTYADGDATVTVSLQVTDSLSRTSVDTATVSVHNVPPTASVNGPASLQPGVSGTFTLGATDPSSVDQAANFTFKIDWDGNGTVDQTVVAPAGSTVSHYFTATGSDTVKVTATDKDGGQSVSASTVVNVAAPAAVTAQLVADPLNSGQMMLLVNGTSGDDDIKIINSDRKTTVTVQVNGVAIGTYSPDSRIVVFGNDGNDSVTHGGAFKRALEEYGGNGDDTLRAGQSGDILVGGAGSDSLVSGQGNDVEIGGTGADKVVGDAGEDLLIAGFTSFDNDLASLNAIGAEWGSTRAFNSRIANLEGNSSNPDFAARLNGNTFLLADVSNATVFDDGAKDTVNGGAGSDWFLFNVSGGVVDKAGGYIVGTDVATDIS